MGTGLELEVWAEDRATALRASESAVRALEATEGRLSTWSETSELAHLNGTPAGTWTVLSPTLAEELARTRELWRSTDGAFDPGIGALVDAWDLRGGGRLPTHSARAAALAASSLRLLSLEDERAARHHPDLRIEEGGFGKGAGLDRAVAELAREGATAAILDLGGQLACFGPGPFRVDVAHPLDRDRIAVTLDVEAGSVATSSNSERGRVVDGARVGHLLDPRTGRPSPHHGSVTVWTSSALDADALATGLFVLGKDAALAYAEHAPGVEVLILEPQPDGGLLAHSSSGLEGRLSTSDPTCNSPELP